MNPIAAITPRQHHPVKHQPILLKLINFIPPQILEKVFGYPGQARWLSLYWEEAFDCPICADPQRCYQGNKKAWRLLLSRPALKQATAETPIAANAFLLDRQDRKLYMGSRDVVKGLLLQSDTLNLMAEVSAVQP